MKKIFYVLLLLFTCFVVVNNYVYSQSASAYITIYPSANVEPVCPGDWLPYSITVVDVNNGSLPSACKYKWTVENGQILGVNGTTVTNDGSGPISIMWNNTTSKGKITVSIEECNYTGSKTETYTILSISGQTPSTPSGNTSFNVPFCASSANFAVLAMKYPGTQTNVPLYEWVIPSGWKYSSTEISDGNTPFRTSSRSISVIPAGCGGTSVKVRGVNICDSSPEYYGDWLNLTVNRSYGVSITGQNSVNCGTNQSVTYSVPATSCNTSYAWTAPAGWTSSNTTGNSVTFQTNGQPGGEVKVTVNSCGTTGSAKKTVKTALTPTISGPSLFCGTSATFSVNDGTSATWTLSPSSMFVTSSGTGKSVTIQSKVTQGQGTITFNVQGCGISKTVSKTFCIGKPFGPLTTPSGTPAVQTIPGQLTQVQASFPCATASSLNWWTSSSNLRIKSIGSGNVVVESRATGYYYLYVTSSNACGTSAYRQIPFNVTYNGGGGTTPPGPVNPLVVVYPNPVDEVLTVELADSSSTSTNSTISFSSSTIKTYNLTSTNANSTVDSTLSIELYNQDQVKVKGGFSVEGKVQIEVHDLQPGTYFLHVRFQEAILQKQIVIE